MNQKKKLPEMKQGVRYRGWGYVNEYREFVFEPEQTGSREGVVKAICTRDGVRLSQTRENLLVYLKVKKSSDKLELIKRILGKFNIVNQLLNEYEI